MDELSSIQVLAIGLAVALGVYGLTAMPVSYFYFHSLKRFYTEDLEAELIRRKVKYRLEAEVQQEIDKLGERQNVQVATSETEADVHRPT